MTDLDFIKIKLQDEYKEINKYLEEDKLKGFDNKYLSGKAEQLREVELWIDQMIGRNWNKEAIIFNYITKKIKL